MRIYHEGENKTLTFKKNDLYQEVALKIIEEFGLGEISLDNFRLRSYDPKIKAKMAYYEGFDK